MLVRELIQVYGVENDASFEKIEEYTRVTHRMLSTLSPDFAPIMQDAMSEFRHEGRKIFGDFSQ